MKGTAQVDADSAQDEFADLLALVEEQMVDLAAARQKRAALTARATAADETVEVTVDARGVVINTVIDESYADEFDFADLGGYITAAAQAAAGEVARQGAELMAPLRDRRRLMPSLSDIVQGAPDLQSLLNRVDPGAPTESVDDESGWDDPTVHPTVRS